VRAALASGGRALFVDDAYRTPDELIEGPASSVVRRRLEDGSTYRAVKVPHTPEELQARITALGWDVNVRPTAGPFYWGTATPSAL
jgi:demethylmenaquinone methyltransferase/2-methoxy-6-polyprenyl-1,4-benzoquinol methylase